MVDQKKLQELKKEIEVLKAKLRRCIDESYNIDSIMQLNCEIDELIVKYHLLQKEK
jgi:uncharacterized membrane protein (DUF106 family)